MEKKNVPWNTTQELRETLADAKADLEAARAELLQTKDAALRAIIDEEIAAIMEEIALLEDELNPDE